MTTIPEPDGGRASTSFVVSRRIRGDNVHSRPGQPVRRYLEWACGHWEAQQGIVVQSEKLFSCGWYDMRMYRRIPC